MDRSRAEWWSRAAELYAAGLFLAYTILIFVHAGAPSLTDYANWTYQGILFREHLLGHAENAHRLKLYPVPNSLTTVAIGFAALAMPWLLAAKTWLAVQLALCFAAMRMLLKVVKAPPVAWLVVPQAVFLNVNFWYGFMNFELGLAWVMVFVALLVQRARPWTLMLVLVLAFFTHMIPFCFSLLLFVLWCWRPSRWRALWAAAPSLALTLWYVLGRFFLAGNADGQAGMRETVRNYSAAFWAFKLNSYAKSFGFANPLGLAENTFGRAGLCLLLAANAFLALTVLWSLSRCIRWRAPEHRPIWNALSFTLPIFLLAPGAALGVSDPGARVLQTGLALALVLCCSSLGRIARVIVGSCSAALAVSGAVLFLSYGGMLGVALQPHGEPGLARFARIPNTDQDFYYRALERGDLSLSVFPTGMLLNERSRPR